MMPPEIRSTFWSTARDLRAGDVVYDLARNRPMVVDEPKGAYRTCDHETRNAIDNAYTNDFFEYDSDTDVISCVYLNTQSKPSKTYDFIEPRLARPRVEAATGLNAAELSEVSLLGRMFTLLKSSEEKDALEDLLRELATDATFGRVVKEAESVARVQADELDFNYEIVDE